MIYWQHIRIRKVSHTQIETCTIKSPHLLINFNPLLNYFSWNSFLPLPISFSSTPTSTFHLRPHNQHHELGFFKYLVSISIPFRRSPFTVSRSDCRGGTWVRLVLVKIKIWIRISSNQWRGTGSDVWESTSRKQQKLGISWVGQFLIMKSIFVEQTSALLFLLGFFN